MELDERSKKDIDEVFSVLSVVKFGGFDAFEVLQHNQQYYSKYSHIKLNEALLQVFLLFHVFHDAMCRGDGDFQ